jgi:RNA polymerase sigma factor (sigma-70 family)
MALNLREPDLVSDGSLIAESISRPEAFSAVFDRHYSAIYGYLARRAGRDVAEDVASQTFTVAFERRRTFVLGTESARPWLFGIACNLLHARRRTDRRLAETAAVLVADGAARDASAQGDPALRGPVVEDDRLAGVLGRLEASWRDVLLLHAWGELSYEEIAGVLCIPVGTVRSRLARARGHLRAELAAPTLVPSGGGHRDHEQEQL